MLRTAAIAALALLAAGCMASDDEAPPNADPNGPEPTLPPASSTSSTGLPTTASSSGSPSSAAPAPGVDLADGHEEDLGTHADFPGLIVAGQVDVGGDVARLQANANNNGQRTYRVSNVCVAPWSEAMEGPAGADAQHREPFGSCAAFGLRDFPPGESIPFTAAWNGTLWTGDGYAPAPAGTYTWVASFQVYSGGEGSDFDESATIALEFQVTVS